MPVSKGRKKAKRRPPPPPSKAEVVAAHTPAMWQAPVIIALLVGGSVVAIIGAFEWIPLSLGVIVGAIAVGVGFFLALNFPTPFSSPVWYQVLMFALMGVGIIIILLNYVDLLPGGTDTKYLVLGLGGIAVGFGMTMNFH